MGSGVQRVSEVGGVLLVHVPPLPSKINIQTHNTQVGAGEASMRQLIK